MTKENINGKKGFTIIEVVLVLAIAGLIFLMVFVALPALQRSQRDTQRRQDYADLSAAISSYSTNNNGVLARLVGGKNATSCKNLSTSATQYINKDGKDPNGNDYNLYACNIASFNSAMTASPNTKVPDESSVYVVVGADCSGSNKDGSAAPGQNSSSRSYAVYGYLEGGNNSYCSESQ